jgi:hypothetical protein
MGSLSPARPGLLAFFVINLPEVRPSFRLSRTFGESVPASLEGPCLESPKERESPPLDHLRFIRFEGRLETGCVARFSAPAVWPPTEPFSLRCPRDAERPSAGRRYRGRMLAAIRRVLFTHCGRHYQ